MKQCALLLFFSGIFSLAAMSGETEPVKSTMVRVLGNNVNLRARPALTSETVGQVSESDELKAISFMEEWVEVVPPPSVDLWVLGDYVKDEKIDGENVNVRAGAGINFSIVGQLSRGAELKVRDTFGQWVRIEPPDGSSLWIHSSLVETVPEEVEEEPEIFLIERTDEKEPPPDIEIDETDERVAEEPDLDAVLAAPYDLDLLPLRAQGKLVQYEGILRPRRFLVRSPTRFRLVAYDERGRAVTVCLVKGNDVQLGKLRNRHMIIKGREYWVRRSEYPVLVPERITLTGK